MYCMCVFVQGPGNILSMGSVSEALQLCVGGQDEEAHPVTQVDNDHYFLQLQMCLSIQLYDGVMLSYINCSIALLWFVCQKTSDSLSVKYRQQIIPRL